MKRLLYWYQCKISIRRKLIYSYIFLVLFPTVVLGIYTYNNSRKSLISQTMLTIENNADVAVTTIENNIERENENIRYLSYNVKFREKLKNGSDDLPGLASVLNESVEPTLWYFLTSDRIMKEISIYSPYVNDKVGSFVFPMENYTRKEEYDHNSGDFATKWFSEDGSIYAERILLDASTSSKKIGVIRLQVRRDALFTAVFQTEYMNSQIAIFDVKGEALSINSEAEGKTDYLWNLIQSFPEGMSESEEGRFAVAKIEGTEWKLIYYTDNDYISNSLRNIRDKTIAVTLLCFLVMLIFIDLLSKVLTQRLFHLKKCAETVSRGEFKLAQPLEGGDEIAVVEKSFYEMACRIDTMMTEVYNLGLQKRAEELKVLQAKINPHFLYNCLSSITWKALKAEQDDIVEITGLVAKFYRTSLNGGKEICTVQNELDNVRAYLDIQQRTHDYSFKVIYDLSDEGCDCEMPNFLLQPIVENAVLHGIDTFENSSEGIIWVKYQEEEESLIFEIVNNGRTIDEDKINNLFATSTHRYGLYNVRERIRMYYTEDTGRISCGIDEDGHVYFRVVLSKNMKEV